MTLDSILFPDTGDEPHHALSPTAHLLDERCWFHRFRRVTGLSMD